MTDMDRQDAEDFMTLVPWLDPFVIGPGPHAARQRLMERALRILEGPPEILVTSLSEPVVEHGTTRWTAIEATTDARIQILFAHGQLTVQQFGDRQATLYSEPVGASEHSWRMTTEEMLRHTNMRMID